ncbi:MAG: DUF1844 domain-containing protein [Thermoanaerobaculaceae bacterium]
MRKMGQGRDVEVLVSEAKDGKVKVVDRRWFTAEGELKNEPQPQAPAPQPPPPETAAPMIELDDQPRRDPEPGPATSAVGFLDLVDFLAQQAAALVSGQIPGRGRDPQMARFFIDLLGVVQDKTNGQLSTEEASYLEDVLYQLRSLFVATTR